MSTFIDPTGARPCLTMTATMALGTVAWVILVCLSLSMISNKSKRI